MFFTGVRWPALFDFGQPFFEYGGFFSLMLDVLFKVRAFGIDFRFYLKQRFILSFRKILLVVSSGSFTRLYLLPGRLNRQRVY